MTQGKRRQRLLAVARRWQTSTDTQETFAPVRVVLTALQPSC